MASIERLLKRARKEMSALPKISGKPQVISFILDSRDRIISTGNNSYEKSHPRQKEYADRANDGEKVFLHSEIHGILKANLRNGRPRRIEKIFIARFLQNGQTGLASPCHICRIALEEAGIKTIMYTMENGVFVEIK